MRTRETSIKKKETAPKKSKKPIDPAKDLLKRFRAAKRAAKFYNGMMKEFEVVDTHMTDYGKLLGLWGGKRDAYPWTPPSKGYTLPKTLKEFEAEYDAAFKEFDKVIAEGQAMNVLTTKPKEKKAKAAAAPSSVTVVITESHTGLRENCKECLKRHIPTDGQRAQSELYNACGNLEGDEECENEGDGE